MSEPIYFYTLIDPRTQAVRYVGKAVDVERRCYVHFADSSTTHKALWIQTLRALGLKPDVQVIDCLNSDDPTSWQDRERFWISFYREQGCDLTNTTDGGEGCEGTERSFETKFKIGLTNGGEGNGRAKLNNETVYSIRVRCAAGESRKMLALEFDVSKGTIDGIANGSTWTSVGGPLTKRKVGSL